MSHDPIHMSVKNTNSDPGSFAPAPRESLQYAGADVARRGMTRKKSRAPITRPGPLPRVARNPPA